MNLEKLVKKAIGSVKEEDNILGKGSDGIVYAVNEKVVLKVHTGHRKSDYHEFYHHSSRETAEFEFNIGRELHLKGVLVPEYIALFKPLDSPSLQYWGIFMERIYGVKYNALSLRLQQEAKSQYEEQTKLIRNLGYCIADNYLCLASNKNDSGHNTLFNKQQRKLFLFDLVRWTKL